MPITVRHAPRGITGARARALYGAKRGAEQPWWDRFGRSMQTAAQMYGRQRLQERRIEAGEERMRMGAEFQERAGEARLGREKEMVDYRGEAAVQGIGQIGEAQRAEREKASRLREQKINDWVDAGDGTPEEAQPLIDNERRLRANMPPKQKEPTPEEIWQKTTRVDPETGKQFMKKGVWEQVKEDKGEAKLEPWRPGQMRNADVLKDAMKDVQQEESRRKMAAEDGYTAPSMEEQDRRVKERYDQLVRLRLGLDAPPPPSPPRAGIPFGDVDAVTGAARLGGLPSGAGGPPPAAAAPPQANVDVTDFATGKQYRVPDFLLARELKPEQAQAATVALQQRGISGQEAQQALSEYSAHEARMDKFQQEGDTEAIAREIRGWREYRKRMFGS